MDIVNKTSNLSLKDDQNIYQKCFFACCLGFAINLFFYNYCMLATIVKNNNSKLL